MAEITYVVINTNLNKLKNIPKVMPRKARFVKKIQPYRNWIKKYPTAEAFANAQMEPANHAKGITWYTSDIEGNRETTRQDWIDLYHETFPEHSQRKREFAMHQRKKIPIGLLRRILAGPSANLRLSRYKKATQPKKK